MHVRLNTVRAGLHRRAHALEAVLRPLRLVPPVSDRLREETGRVSGGGDGGRERRCEFKSATFSCLFFFNSRLYTSPTRCDGHRGVWQRAEVRMGGDVPSGRSSNNEAGSMLGRGFTCVDGNEILNELSVKRIM